MLLNGFLSFQSDLFRFLGLVPLFIGILVALWTVISFALVGKGTPAPFDPTKKLVIGLFRYVRNPMYLGAVSVMVGEAVLLQSFGLFLLAVVMWMFFHTFVVYYEEPNLRKKFGEEYVEYMKAVPRWLPKIMKLKSE